jgi:adenine-specific DNA-methyltransferase
MPTLTWTGKEDALRAASLVPFRLLEPHTAAKVGIIGDPKAAQDNLLIQGDNLEALKALLPYYAGRVKCIYIDPPYNTGSAFEHYDDNLEHSTWLSMMYPRLELLRELLAEDGSIWVTLDDAEAHYFKVIGDEVFGRSNFIGNIVWNHSVQSKGYSGKLSIHHNHILAYRKSSCFVLLDKPRTEEHNVNYSNPDNDPRGPWRAGDVRNSLVRPNLMYDITTPSGKVIKHPPKGWRFSRTRFDAELAEGKIVFSKDETRIIRKIYLSDQEGRVPESLWFAQDAGTTREANKEVQAILGSVAFETPKPEQLILRILEISTVSGDLVLDSFLGSGTTAAVAHKMGRRWIGIEMGDHAVTHCLPRLQKVIDGEQGGISEFVGWKGGGGFRIVMLGETLFDAFGRLNPKVKFADLAAFVWWRETKAPAIGGSIKPASPFLGVHEGRGLYLLYNGILGDKRPKGGNVLTPAVLASLPKHDGPRIVYAEATTYTPSSLARMNITFKQIPYDLGSIPLLAEGALEYAAGLMPEVPQALAARTASAGEEGDHV